MEPYKYIADLLQELPAITSETTISRTIYDDNQMRVTLFGFAAGQQLTEHTATRPAILHFLQGEGTLTLGEDVQEVAAGSWAHMAANLPHAILAKTDLVMLLILLK